MRYKCNYCNNEPCYFDSSTPDNLKPGLCPIVKQDGETFDGVDWQPAPLKAESAEKSDNKQSESLLCPECNSDDIADQPNKRNHCRSCGNWWKQ